METYLAHHGILGMKWGIRRYQNKDGTLTAAGKKHYRKDYDAIKLAQRTSQNIKNATGISFVDEYNKAYYQKRIDAKIKVLIKQIGDRGVSDLDEEVIREGEKIAQKAKHDAEIWNRSIQEKYDMKYEFNQRFLRDPQYDYDYKLRRYLEDNLVSR